MEKLDIEDLFGEHENGRPKDPIEELLTKINEIIDLLSNESPLATILIPSVASDNYI